MRKNKSKSCINQTEKVSKIIKEGTSISEKIRDSKIKEFHKLYPDITKFNLANYLLELYRSNKEIDIEFMKYILELDIDINKKDYKEMNAFHIAVAMGNISLAKHLLMTDINYKDTIKVAIDCHVMGLQEFLDAFVDEQYTRKQSIKYYEISAFAIAWYKYNPEIVKLLIENGFNPNENIISTYSMNEFLNKEVISASNDSAIGVICEENDVDLLKFFIEKGASKFNISELIKACKNLNFEMIKLLVENGVNINYNAGIYNKKEEDEFSEEFWKSNPLSIVCSFSTIIPCSNNRVACTDITSDEVYSIIKYLIDNGADINIDSPLMAACSSVYLPDCKCTDKFYADVNIDIINLLISKGADVNFAKCTGESILMKAVKRTNGLELAKILIKNGADVNHKDKNQYSCLFHLNYEEGYTSNRKYLESDSNNTLRLLIDNGADINVRDKLGITALKKFSSKGYKHFVKILLERGADIDIKDETDFYLDYIPYINLAEYLQNFYETKKAVNIEVVKFLFKNGIDIFTSTPSDLKLNAFIYALLCENNELTKLFIEYNIDVNDDITIKADKEKYYKSKEYEFIFPYAKFKEQNTIKPIDIAFATMNEENIILLLKNGVDMNTPILNIRRINNGLIYDEKRLPLEIACEYKMIKVIEFYLTSNINIKINLNIVELVKEGNLEILRKLFTKGVNPYHKRNISEFTPMIEALQGGSLLDICASSKDKNHIEIAKLLIEMGASTQEKNQALMTSINTLNISFNLNINLDSKERYFNVAMIKLLILNGADVNYKDKDGKSVLMEACSPKENDADYKYAVVKLLIDSGADVNAFDKNNNTALMIIKDHETVKYSSEYNCKVPNEYGKLEDISVPCAPEVLPSEKVMLLLLDNGAKIDLKNNMGMTALMQHSLKGENKLVKILLERGADVNAKSEVTAFDLANNTEIKKFIQATRNNNPQKLVKLLSNFTIDKPIKYTTHSWDFGSLSSSDYKNFDGYMDAVKKQLEFIKSELEELSPNLYKKIYTFLIETKPDKNYSWCSKTHINIGWSSLEGLKEHCDSGQSPFSFRLQNVVHYDGQDLTTFEDIINLFKQDIEIRANFKNLKSIFDFQINKLCTGRKSIFKLDISTAKLSRQFYTDVEKFSNVIDKIFNDMATRKEYPNIKVTTTEFDDRSIEINITQIDSNSTRSAKELLDRVKEAGDIKDIKESLTNLCDWSVESSYAGENFRINFLHSNNEKEIIKLDTKPYGFTHILRFYK